MLVRIFGPGEDELRELRVDAATAALLGVQLVETRDKTVEYAPGKMIEKYGHARLAFDGELLCVSEARINFITTGDCLDSILHLIVKHFPKTEEDDGETV